MLTGILITCGCGLIFKDENAAQQHFKKCKHLNEKPSPSTRNPARKRIKGEPVSEKMKSVVINRCFGGFSISPEAALWLDSKGFNEPDFKTPIDEYYSSDRDPDKICGRNYSLKKWREYLQEVRSKRDSLFVTVFTKDEKFVLSTRPSSRTHPLLIECVKELKDAASGACADLKIIEVPAKIDFEIDEYDGMETVHETHRSWS